jgi:syntaxin 5
LRSRKSLNADSPLYAQPSAPYDAKGKGKATDADFLALDMGGSPSVPMQQTQDGFMQMQLVDQEVRCICPPQAMLIPGLEHLSLLAIDGHRIDRVHYRRAGTDLRSTSPDGRATGRDGAAHRRRHVRYREVRARTYMYGPTEAELHSNVTGAQRELLKYYASVSSNRWLMLKVFGVLIMCAARLAPHDTLLTLRSFFLIFVLVS